MQTKKRKSGSLVRRRDEALDVTLKSIAAPKPPRSQEFNTLWNTLETQLTDNTNSGLQPDTLPSAAAANSERWRPGSSALLIQRPRKHPCATATTRARLSRGFGRSCTRTGLPLRTRLAADSGKIQRRCCGYISRWTFWHATYKLPSEPWQQAKDIRYTATGSARHCRPRLVPG